jgi:hypothetical protein
MSTPNHIFITGRQQNDMALGVQLIKKGTTTYSVQK